MAQLEKPPVDTLRPNQSSHSLGNQSLSEEPSPSMSPYAKYRLHRIGSKTFESPMRKNESFISEIDEEIVQVFESLEGSPYSRRYPASEKRFVSAIELDTHSPLTHWMHLVRRAMTDTKPSAMFESDFLFHFENNERNETYQRRRSI